MYGIHIINERNFIVACAILNDEELYTKTSIKYEYEYEYVLVSRLSAY